MARRHHSDGPFGPNGRARLVGSFWLIASGSADPDLGHELAQRTFQVLARRRQTTRDRLIARSVA